jgi:hypothetical protein
VGNPFVVRSLPMPSREWVPSDSEFADAECWRLADGLMFGVLSSLVLWSFLLASLYRAFV